jgi:hypothetical protein
MVRIFLAVHMSVVKTSFSAGCTFIYISSAAPSKDTLGSTNGLVQMTASTMRTIALSVASSLFSFSLESGLAGGTGVYWILSTVVLAGLYASRTLPTN